MSEVNEIPRVSNFGTPVSQFGEGIIVLTDPSDEVARINLRLKGYTKQVDGSWAKTDDEWLNDDGVSKIMANIEPNVSQNIHLSNYEERDVSNMMLNVSDTIIETLLMGRVKYGLKEASNRNIIYNMCVNPSYASYRRGFKEGDKRFLSKTSQDVKHTIEQTSKGGGWLDKFNPFGRKS